MHNPAIVDLVASLESENKHLRLEWIPCSQITDIEPTQIDNVYSAIRWKKTTIMLSLLGLEVMRYVHQRLRVSLPEYTHLQHTSTIMMSVNIDDIPNGLVIAMNS